MLEFLTALKPLTGVITLQSRIDYQTLYADYPMHEIKQMIQNEANERAKIEFVNRSFSIFTLQSTVDQAITICDKEIAKNPQHNFFNFARALHETDYDKKLAYLRIATHSTIPCGEQISIQAANILYNLCSKNTYGYHYWQVKAILLGSKQAQEDFCNDDSGVVDVRKFTICVIFLATLLENKKIDGFLESRILCVFLANQRPPIANSFRLAYQQIFKLDDLHLDSPIRNIALHAISYSTKLFYNFFNVCFKNAIIREEVFLHLMRFYLESDYTHHGTARADAISDLSQRGLMEKVHFGTQPGIYQTFYAPKIYSQHPSYTLYPTLQPSAPPEENASDKLVPIYKKR